jgi:hypothetical protein
VQDAHGGDLLPAPGLQLLRNSNIAIEKCSSCGLVRKNHLKPRRWRVGEDDSPERYGTPTRSHTVLAVAETLLW